MFDEDDKRDDDAEVGDDAIDALADESGDDEDEVEEGNGMNEFGDPIERDE